MKQEVKIGQTDYTVLVFIPDSSSSTGAGNTGLAYTDIDLAYVRVETDNDVTVTDVAPATLSLLTDAHSDWGFLEVDATNAPGLYRLDLADAVFATGAWSAAVVITDAASNNIPPVSMEFVLVPTAPYVGVNVNAWDDGTAVATPNVAGVPVTDVNYWKGSAANDQTSLAQLLTAMFTTDSSSTYGDSVAGSVVKEIADNVTLANGAHGGAAATITAKSIAVTNSDAGGVAMSLTGSGTGNSHALSLSSTNAKAIAAASTNSDAITVNAPAGHALTLTDVYATAAVAVAAMLSGVRVNTAQAGGTSTQIILDASASASNDFYNGCLVKIISGTGIGQRRWITDYVGLSKIATVDTAWVTNPDATSIFVVA